MRTPLLAGNFKMFKTVSETVSYISDLRSLAKDMRGVDIVIAPPFTAIAAAAGAVIDSNIAVSAQDLHWEREGAFTGEVSAGMLREAGARYAIIGHSERRTLFGETNATVNKKAHAAIAGGLVPIVCIGETLEQRDRNETMSVLDKQIKEGFDGLTGEQLSAMVLAYEPVWAIGTGRNATPEQAQAVHAFIRARVAAADARIAAELRILYGGSVKAGNAAELFAMPDVDGGLIGGASLKADEFLAILKAV
jgi:triosephosphate isomerase